MERVEVELLAIYEAEAGRRVVSLYSALCMAAALEAPWKQLMHATPPNVCTPRPLPPLPWPGTSGFLPDLGPAFERIALLST